MRPPAPIHLLATCLAAALLASPGAAAQESGAVSSAALLNTLTAAERAAGWRLLFDGKTTAGWRGWKMDSMPSGWTAVDGALTRTSRAADIITTEKFEDFELALEWNIAPKGNSGIFYRASEDDTDIYWTAPEMQVLDDAGHPEEARTRSAGSNYDLHAAPAGIAKPAGQWNAVRLRVHGNRVEHWLNGVKVVEYELLSPDWEAKVKASKFAPHQRYGRNREGYIGLQEHGAWVAYRNIKIRAVP